jgi:hypothetical protein
MLAGQGINQCVFWESWRWAPCWRGAASWPESKIARSTSKLRQQYEESASGYRSCLGANQANPRTCEAQRLAMESDERAFNNISGHAVNINVQQR